MAQQQKDNPAIKDMEARRDELARANAETEKRVANSKPTPTQEENDLAKIGALDIDSKEDDGSGPDLRVQNEQHRALSAEQSKGDYKTRSATPPQQPQHRDEKK